MRRGTHGRRRGASGLVALLAMGPLLILVGVVLYVALLRDAKGESQTAADAAALAAARELATDDMLTEDVERGKARLARARLAALTLAQSNLAVGERLNLDLNETNAEDGDVVFGDRPAPPAGTARAFVPAGTDSANWAGRRVTAVRVTVHRSPLDAPFGGNPSDRKVLAGATAELDFAVVGLRPTNDTDPVPLVPVALFPSQKPPPVVDEWAFDPVAKKFVFGTGDGIPEFPVVIGSPPDEARPGAFLQVGGANLPFDETIGQLAGGVRRPVLADKFRSEFVLDRINILSVVGSPSPPAAGSEYRRLAVEALKAAGDPAQPRVWPLASDFDGESVRVTGFTGARVVAVRDGSAGIELLLQPAVYCSPAVVTEVRTPAPEFWADNRTVCRVRLAD